MSKSAQTRLDQTTGFIRERMFLIPKPVRDAVMQGLDHYINNVVVKGSTAPSTTLSKSMSLKDLSSAGDKLQRHGRRAIDLLYKAMKGVSFDLTSETPTLTEHASSVAANGVEAALDLAIRKAAAYYSEQGAKLAFELLVADPLEFLRRNPIFVAGTIRGKDLYTQNPAPAEFRNVVDCWFGYKSAADQYIFDTVDPQLGGRKGYKFSACSVPAINWSEVPGRGAVASPPMGSGATFAQLRGIRFGKADVMITTQFTGCSFCYQPEGNTVYAAHVSPGGASLDKTELAEQLCGNRPNVAAAVFSNIPHPAGQLNIFGCGAGNAAVPNGTPHYTRNNNAVNENDRSRHMSIIGLRRNHQWALYTQSLDMANRAVDYRRIF